MSRVERIFICTVIGLALPYLAGCEKVIYWEKLPPATSPRVVRIAGDNEAIIRGLRITRLLVNAAPVPASLIFVMTLTYYRTEIYKSAPIFDDRARAFRCTPKGEPMDEKVTPSSACIVLPEAYLDQLSDDSLAAIIAHELGHIEKGHKSWEGMAEPILVQWEADEAATDRLYRAGYCAGEVIRNAGTEIASIYARGATHPWRDYPADCKPKQAKALSVEDFSRVLYNRGRVFQSKREYRRAIAVYTEAIQLNPNYAAAFNSRGNAYRAQGEYDRAIRDYDEATRLNPNYALAFNNRARAYNGKRQYQRALADHESAARIAPKAADHLRMGRQFFYLGRFAESAEAMSRALKASPQNSHAMLWRYLAQARTGGAQAASQELAVNAAKLTERRWPAPVIDFYLGKTDQNAMYAAADGADSERRSERICEADFYAAQAKILIDATGDAIALLRAAVRECPPTFVEAHGARAELKRLGF